VFRWGGVEGLGFLGDFDSCELDFDRMANICFRSKFLEASVRHVAATLQTRGRHVVDFHWTVHMDWASDRTVQGTFEKVVIIFRPLGNGACI
jgi:hypothetical protein